MSHVTTNKSSYQMCLSSLKNQEHNSWYMYVAGFFSVLKQESNEKSLNNAVSILCFLFPYNR